MVVCSFFTFIYNSCVLLVGWVTPHLLESLVQVIVIYTNFILDNPPGRFEHAVRVRAHVRKHAAKGGEG